MVLQQQNWSEMQCVPCSDNVAPVQGEALKKVLLGLPGWQAVEQHHLTKTYTFKNFVDALAFVNRVGEIAEHENHHPDIYLTWGKVRIDTFTHTINGINDNDFILAAKIDRIS